MSRPSPIRASTRILPTGRVARVFVKPEQKPTLGQLVGRGVIGGSFADPPTNVSLSGPPRIRETDRKSRVLSGPLIPTLADQNVDKHLAERARKVKRARVSQKPTLADQNVAKNFERFISGNWLARVGAMGPLGTLR
jgi:hypothetical protein